jgi:polysaccharide chain length determinant protein (PEP-CTERM system associated)
MKQSSFSEFFQFLSQLYRRRYLFLLVALIVISAAIAVSYSLPKKYQADSTVFVEENMIKNLVKGLAVTTDMSSRIKVIRYTLLSRELIQKALNEIDLDLGIKNERQLQEFITELQKRTDIKIRNGDLFIISIIDKNPRFAQQFINKLVSKYVEENISAKRDETYGANRFIDEQLITFKGKLDQAENAIIEFRNQYGIYSAADETGMLAEIKNYEHAIEEIELTLGTLRARINRLRDQMQSVAPTISLFSEKQKDNRVAQLQQKIGQLLVTYTTGYPEVLKLQAEIDALKNQGEEQESLSESSMTAVNPLHQELQQKIFDAQAEMSALAARRDKLKEFRAERELGLQSVPETKKRLAVLIQERDSYKNIYDQLLLRLGQSEVSKQMELGDKTTTFRIVDPAVFPKQPASPDMVKMILLSILAGLAAGAGLVYLLESLDGSVRDTREIRELGLELLAVIPRIEDKALQGRQLRRDLLVYALVGIFGCGLLGLFGFEVLKKIGKL